MTEFFLGLIIAAFSKNVIKILISVEILINTVNSFLVFFSVYFAGGKLDPLVALIVIISIIISAILAAFILIIFYKIEEKFNTLEAEKVSELRW
jgi:NADH:ubiquinone oxidoreductase subunit K